MTVGLVQGLDNRLKLFWRKRCQSLLQALHQPGNCRVNLGRGVLYCEGIFRSARRAIDTGINFDTEWIPGQPVQILANRIE